MGKESGQAQIRAVEGLRVLGPLGRVPASSSGRLLDGRLGSGGRRGKGNQNQAVCNLVMVSWPMAEETRTGSTVP
ncbi:hypothetical protein Cob_v000982 [Colletotrichum orbiculare MAFF 240422]|uniref:Uncharacterized protein n=1 Tax=Colletotrichum orbiculare (strain 104-T / ATCC 96160 / CBS 514.97 / LARS 414 / MAFF 240422) TaxID=1213857 RepID=A0A484G8S5_COLOR|nr:hypothetical protein Cob_v000982 [Colletotrichum orbiculare MAFF 240422]